MPHPYIDWHRILPLIATRAGISIRHCGVML